jgi:outer membrane receptor protein involved in Fe transport
MQMQVVSQIATQSTKQRKRMLALAIAALCAGQSITVANAAEANAAASNEDMLVLEPIVVTAQKREESLNTVPLAVSAMSGEQLANAGVNNVSDLSKQVPSLEVQSSVSPVMTNFRIRRVGNLGNIPTFEPAVGLFVDGAFRSRAIFGATDLFDVERIEILRGPQSTLYGKNTTAGVIGIYTAAPGDSLHVNAEATGGKIEGGAGDATLTQFKASVSGPLSDSFGAGIGGSFTQHGDTMGEALTKTGKNGNDAGRYSVRGQLAWDVTDAFDMRLIVGVINEDDTQQTADITLDPNGFLATNILPAWRLAGIADTCTDNDPHNRITCVQQPLTTDLNAREATLLANYHFANGLTLASVSSYDYYMFRGTMNDAAQMMTPLLQFHDAQESQSLQQEFRLSSANDQKITWQAGAFYYTNEFKRGDDGKNPVWVGDTYSNSQAVKDQNALWFGAAFPMAADGQVGYLASNLDTEYLGIYGQTTWNITDQIGVTAGARWQEETKDANIQQWVNIPTASIMQRALAPAAVSKNGLHRKTDDTTWSLTPTWKVTPDAMLYATAAHGFKSGGFNTGFGALAIDKREFGDEDIMHYEAGAKFDLFNSRARLAASVFQTEFNNYQDAAFVGGQFTVGNAEQARLRGAELEGTVLVARHLTADASVSYADFIYTTNTHGQCYPNRPGAVANQSCDLSGEHPINAPEWKTHMGVQYDQPVQWGSLYTRADWSWTSEYNTSFSADPRLQQAAYDWINLRAGARWSNYEAVLWVDNVTNETVANMDPVVTVYATQAGNPSYKDASYQSLLQDARSYGVTLKMKF